MKKIILSILILLLTFVTLGYKFLPNSNMLAYADEPVTFSFDIDMNFTSTSSTYGITWYSMFNHIGTSNTAISTDLLYLDETYAVITYNIAFDSYYGGVSQGVIYIPFQFTYLIDVRTGYTPDINEVVLKDVVSMGDNFMLIGFNLLENSVRKLQFVKSSFLIENVDEIHYINSNSNITGHFLSSNLNMSTTQNYITFADNTVMYFFSNMGSTVSYNGLVANRGDRPYFDYTTAYTFYGTQVITPYTYSLQLLPRSQECNIEFWQGGVLVLDRDFNDSYFTEIIDTGVYDIVVSVYNGNFYDLEYTLYLYSDITETKFLELSVSEFQYFITEMFGLNSAIIGTMNRSAGLLFNDLAIWGIGIAWYIITFLFIIFLFKLLFKGGQ